MIFYGIILLVIGLICYGVARGGHGPAVVGTIGWICCAIGLVLLLVGVALLVVPSAGNSVDVDAARMLLLSA